MQYYYVYTHRRADNNVPFYVGKGRASIKTNPYHRAKSRRTRNENWYTIVAQTGFIIEISFITKNEKEAFSKERELITLYGRTMLHTGTLCNISPGGGGGASIPHNPEWSRARFKPCYRYDPEGNYLATHESIRATCRLFGISPTTLRQCIKGKIKSSGGYQWRGYKCENIGKIVYSRYPNMRIRNNIKTTHANKKTKNMRGLPTSKNYLEELSKQEVLSDVLV